LLGARERTRWRLVLPLGWRSAARGQPSDRLATTSDRHLFCLLDQVEQLAEFVSRLEAPTSRMTFPKI
jgi:hypothetical protein